MTEYALVGPGDVITTFSSNVDPNVQTKAGWRWLPVADTKPSYNSATQVLEGPAITVEAMRVTRVWTVRAKTSAELDLALEERLPSAESAIFKVCFNHENRIRALEGKAPISAAQFRATLKALI